jgi:hypothetical protein
VAALAWSGGEGAIWRWSRGRRGRGVSLVRRGSVSVAWDPWRAAAPFMGGARARVLSLNLGISEGIGWRHARGRGIPRHPSPGPTPPLPWCSARGGLTPRWCHARGKGWSHARGDQVQLVAGSEFSLVDFGQGNEPGGGEGSEVVLDGSGVDGGKPGEGSYGRPGASGIIGLISERQEHELGLGGQLHGPGGAPVFEAHGAAPRKAGGVPVAR